MKRLYTDLLEEHVKQYRQMVFLAGPRQVGKTTCCKQLISSSKNAIYLNWDNSADRTQILSGEKALAEKLGLAVLSKEKKLIVFDEIHKYRKWKQFLKGFFDLNESRCKIVVTGSAKMDVYRRGGDSLMGRYFLYRMHPLSVGEIIDITPKTTEITFPKKIAPAQLKKLLEFGGFPEPFKKADKKFSNNWQRLRKQQLVQEDIREINQIQGLSELEYFMDILNNEAGQLLNIASIANHIHVAESTLHRWMEILKSFYYCFTIQPWHKNIRRSIRKTPKLFMWDWSMIGDLGKRYENFIASHLYKATQYWTDIGLGDYQLFYLRDKEKREVDFLVTKNNEPWFLVEAKLSNNRGVSKSLHFYHDVLNTQHAFQVVYDMPYVEVDAFGEADPVIVPASTFLSQLV